jgi:ERCC4-type nuclease
MSPLEALVALNMLPRIGPVRVRRLLEAFGDPSAILKAPEELLKRVEKPRASSVRGRIMPTRWRKSARRKNAAFPS